jgi:hypothetical protein
MRLDELLSKRKNKITPEQYEQLKTQKVFLFNYDHREVWDFGELEDLTEPQARALLNRFWRALKYEKENNVKHPIREIFVIHDGHTDPEWPELLQGLQTEYLFEAFLMNKFDIQRPEFLIDKDSTR